jgi:hypothetical protein
MPEPTRATIGRRGRNWVLDHFNQPVIAEQTLRLYDEITGRKKAHARTP